MKYCSRVYSFFFDTSRVYIWEVLLLGQTVILGEPLYTVGVLKNSSSFNKISITKSKKSLASFLSLSLALSKY